MAVGQSAAAGGDTGSGTDVLLPRSRPCAAAQGTARDPFAVDVQQVLDALHAEWGYLWVLAYRPDSKWPWQARRCEHPVTILAGETPDELVRKLREDAGEAP